MPLWAAVVLVVALLVLVEVANVGLGRLADRRAARRTRGSTRPKL